MHRAQRMLCLPAAALLALLAVLPAGSQSPLPAQPSGDVDFHHVRVNVVDPEASTAFYVTSFVRAFRFVEEDVPGVKSDNALIPFNTAAAPASAEWAPPLWRFGWNTPHAGADYERARHAGLSGRTLDRCSS